MQQDDSEARARALAEKLGLVPAEDYIALTNYTPATEQNKRKRGDSPPFVRIGNSIYYWLDGIKERAQSHTKVPADVPAKDLL